ncbi:MAG: WD40 repeat domain-containing protein [Anaerolineales bacterium]|nr:WD40 repeat domain-containing protein [Anaerolineales bacterium]
MSGILHSRAWIAWLCASLILSACGSALAWSYPPLPSQPATAGAPGAVQSPGLSGLLVVQHPGGRLRLHRLDLTSGQDLPGYPALYFGANFFYRFSPDGKQLAAVLYPRANSARDAELRLIDLHAWRSVSIPLELDNWASLLQFSPDGNLLALATAEPHNELFLFDLARGVELTSLVVEQPIAAMQFTRDGRSLMLYQTRVSYPSLEPEAPLVALLSTPQLEILWQTELDGLRHGLYSLPGKEGEDPHAPENSEWLTPGIAFSPNEDLLFIAHAERERITRVDFSARKLSHLEIRPRLSVLERLLWLTARPASAKMFQGASKQALFSPDGLRLYVLGWVDDAAQQADGEWQFTRRTLGLQAIDPRSGQALDHLDTQATDMSLAPDGKSLALRNYAYGPDPSPPGTQIVSLPGFAPLASLEGQVAFPALSLEGAPLLFSITDEQGPAQQVSVLDGATFQPLAAWKDGLYRAWVIPR